MEAFIITLMNNEYSEKVAARCLSSALKYGVDIQIFEAVTKEEVPEQLKKLKLEWGWANNNTEEIICPHTGLLQFPYAGVKDLKTKIACSLSHYKLWEKCFYMDEPILILEHDAVFIRELPEINFKGICQINDPIGCTPKGQALSYGMKQRGPGIWSKTLMDYKDNRPDGLAGNSAYLLKPFAAQELIMAFRNYGIWPNDATMCIQLFPYLEEYYPFIVETRQGRSTSIHG